MIEGHLEIRVRYNSHQHHRQRQLLPAVVAPNGNQTFTYFLSSSTGNYLDFRQFRPLACLSQVPSDSPTYGVPATQPCPRLCAVMLSPVP